MLAEYHFDYSKAKPNRFALKATLTMNSIKPQGRHDQQETSKIKIIWTEYFKYRVNLRGFNLENIEDILRYSTERYYDCSTDRLELKVPGLI